MPTLEESYAAASSPKSLEDSYNAAVTVGVPAAEQPKEKLMPSFMKSLDMINTGVDRGVKNFTLAMLSKIPLGDAYQKAIKQVDVQSTTEQELNKSTYKGFLPQAGELAGELLATSPAGGAMGAVAKGATLLGKVAPIGLQTAAKYGASALGGAGILAGVESQRYDPEQPGQMVNTEAAANALQNPLAYAAPMLGTAASSWANKAQTVGEFSDILGQQAIPRNTLPEGISKSLKQSVFGFLPALTHTGAQVSEMDKIGTPVWNFITKFADKPGAMTARDISKEAGRTLQSTLKSVKQSVNDAWNQPFKMKTVSDTSAVTDDVIEALSIMKSVGPAIPGVGVPKTLIERTLRKVETDNPLLDRSGKAFVAENAPKFTIEDVKNMQSNIGSAISKIKKEGGGSNEIVDSLSSIRDRLYTHMENNLNPAERTALETAKTQSKMFYDLKSTSPLVEKAMTSEYQSRQLLKKMISVNEPINKQNILDKMSPAGQQDIAAAKLAQEWRTSNTSTGFNIDGFVTRVENNPDLAPMMGSEAYKSLTGLNTYLKNVSSGSKTGWQKPAAVAIGLGVPAALSGAGTGAAVASLASLGAMTFAANHPVLKNLFYGLSKKLPDSTKDLIQKTIGRHLTRAGFFIGTDGVLQEQPK